MVNGRSEMSIASQPKPGGDRPTARLSNFPLPEPYLAALALGAVLHWRRPWRLRVRTTARLAGWSLIAGGSAVTVTSWIAAGKVDLEQPDHLMAHGPYAFSRNPMYVGWGALHLGASLVARSAWMLVGLPIAASLIHRQVRHEEQELAETFGGAFEAYRLTVPRYLPRRRTRPLTL
jgi:protein-S-isoprenylcysteine O-methyltransferase Ste14